MSKRLHDPGPHEGPVNHLLERPFEGPTLAEASRRSGLYRLLLEQEEGDFVARIAEFPGVIARGSDANECARKAREALTIAIATLLEAGKPVPTSQSERRLQLNVRLTAAEQELIKAAASKAGCRTVSEYVRAVALAAAKEESS